MNAASEQTAVPAPRSRRRPLPDVISAVTCRRKLGQWLRLLGDIGVLLVIEMSNAAAGRRRRSEPAQVDLDRVWDLVARAMQWMRALEARFRAEARAANADREPPESLYDGPEHLIYRRRPGVERRPRARPEDGACIAGKSDAEVMAHICADLGVAAVLLGMTEQASQLGVIYEAVPKLLARVAAPRTHEGAAEPAAAMRVRAPGTG